jgi:hypothetical protein
MRTIYFYLIAAAVLCFSCTEKEILPISESSGKPEKVEILAVDTVPGGVSVNYKIPPINDIIEIKAVYTLSNGQTRESSSSFYTSFMTIDGYNDTDEHEALIYTINRAREMSDPVPVKFRPGASSLSKATNSMQIINDFGGVNFNWRNPDKAMLFFEFYTENEQGEMVTMNIVSSKIDSTNISFRGYDTVPYKFAVNIRDNFGNSSGMIYPEGGSIIPLFETKLDKTIQNVMILPGDVSWSFWEGRDANLIDDDILSIGHANNNTVPGASFTIDLGKKAKLSRCILHQRLTPAPSYYYNGRNPHIFEVYSSDDDSDDPSGDWNTWTRQLTCTIIKPSGAPTGTITEDDRIAADNGHEFSFPLDMAPVRYIRVVILANWDTSVTLAHFGEFTTYGLYVEE